MKKLGKIVSYGLLVIGVTHIIFILTRIKKAMELKTCYDIVSTFGEKNVDMSTRPDITSVGAMFSGTTLDYTKAREKRNPYVLEVMASYAGVEVIVPDEWYVETNGRIKMAGIENDTLTYEKRVPDLIIDHNLLFAGLDIKSI